MSKVFIIAEAACTWLHAGLEGAYRSIRAAKECGADAWKTQWTSDPLEMGKRRGMDGEKYRRLAWDQSWHEELADACDVDGIEYMCTVFIPEDIPRIAPYVNRFKVSAFEGTDQAFVHAHATYKRPIIVSVNKKAYKTDYACEVSLLHCVSKYPTPVDEIAVSEMWEQRDNGTWWRRYDGLSDHTQSVLTGAVAVAANASIVEKHVRLSDTPESDPDYRHSLLLDAYYKPSGDCTLFHSSNFKTYVDNIREAERML